MTFLQKRILEVKEIIALDIPGADICALVMMVMKIYRFISFHKDACNSVGGRYLADVSKKPDFAILCLYFPVIFGVQAKARIMYFCNFLYKKMPLFDTI